MLVLLLYQGGVDKRGSRRERGWAWVSVCWGFSLYLCKLSGLTLSGLVTEYTCTYVKLRSTKLFQSLISSGSASQLYPKGEGMFQVRTPPLIFIVTGPPTCKVQREVGFKPKSNNKVIMRANKPNWKSLWFLNQIKPLWYHIATKLTLTWLKMQSQGTEKEKDL